MLFPFYSRNDGIFFFLQKRDRDTHFKNTQILAPRHAFMDLNDQESGVGKMAPFTIWQKPLTDRATFV